MISKFDTPGRFSGSNVIPSVESVTADLILDRIVDAESVIVIREEAFGADFDIFADGSRSDRIRLDGTIDQLGEIGEGRAFTNTDFGQREDLAVLPVECFNEVPCEF